METEFNKLNISDTKNCSYCNKPFTEELCCKEYIRFRMMEGWTSRILDIDKFIKNTLYDGVKNEPMTEGYIYEFLEWVVPFERFTDIKEIGEGGFTKCSLQLGLMVNPETKEFMMIMRFADGVNLRSYLSNNFNNIKWRNKVLFLFYLSLDLKYFHTLKYCHKDFHSGNILRFDNKDESRISDFGLSGPANEQASDGKVYGVIPYIAPEVLNGEPYTSFADIYSLGVVMAELSSGKPSFYNKIHDLNLALAIHIPTAEELFDIFTFCHQSNYGLKKEIENFGYKGKEIKTAFEEADKEIPNISTLYERNSDAIYTSRKLPSSLIYEVIMDELTGVDNKLLKDTNINYLYFCA
ncbi:kinase-like domain-containing protein [Rhizophagus clarus]|uniref:Kinase-like domain-containing protein n=1 Tax=Rhizophagus clarus TaxID=94130 RepID=A0A8H3KV40_9GLOM|nr:kinase-like domain-containing protein [Rhizophagus clarus]